MKKWLIIIVIMMGIYFLFFRKKNPQKEKFYDPIAEEVFKNYSPNKEIARFTNPKTYSTVFVYHQSMRHILERHHPNYPPDPQKGKGSLFTEKTTVEEINQGIQTVLKVGQRNQYKERTDKNYVVYEGNTTIHNKRSLYRLVLHPRHNHRERVVTFFPVD